MKGGKQVKLLISESSSDIDSETQQLNTRQLPNIKKIMNSKIEQSINEEDEAAIEDMIRQSQIKNKDNQGKVGKQSHFGVKSVETNYLAGQTQTIQGLKKQIKGPAMTQRPFDANRYQFIPEDNKKAVKNLLSWEQNKRQSNMSLTLEGEFKGKPKIKIIDHALKNTQTQIKIEGIPVYFPYQPYNLQVDYMKAVIQAINKSQNALLQSPTGTGKTLCLLSSVLSWVDNFKCQSQQKINVIYCSRTHTQLRQVQQELEKTCFRPTMSNFGSRDQFCIKEQFSAIKGRDLMESCSKAVKLFLKAKRKLQIEQEVKQGDQIDGNIKQMPHTCYFYKSETEYQKILEMNYMNKIVTSQKIKEEGKMNGFCPYYYAFQIKQKADLIFMPYNYILDVERIPRYESLIQNSIIIFDEAHNVPEAACQGRSFSIYSNIFVNIDAELKKLQHHPFMSQQLKEVSYIFEATIQLLKKQVTFLKEKMDQLAQHVYKKQLLNNQNAYGAENFDIEQIFKPQDLKIMIYNWFGTQHYQISEFEAMSRIKQKEIHMKVMVKLNKITKETNDLIEALKETYDGIFQNLQKLNNFIDKCKDLTQDFDGEMANDWWTKEVNHYRLSVKCNGKDNNFLYQIKLICLTPSLTFKDISRYNPRSIILTSGTLAPLDTWQRQLNFKFPVKLLNKHVIKKEQIHLGIVCKSLQNESNFTFSYNQMQNNNKIYRNLVKTIVHVSHQVPNGMLVIFPSYKVIKNFKDQLSRNTQMLNELRGAKNICYEDKGSIEYIVQNFKNKAKTKKGAALFCVCRGKVSEGLDFADQLCRAVIFVGVPYPNVKDPILKQKRDYYDKLSIASRNKGVLSLTGDEWYTLNTMRAVNQGIGRVIRHINDYGMILMFDSRYEQPKLRNMLPMWTKDSMGVYHDFGDIDRKLINFYEDMRIKFPPSIQQKPRDFQQSQQGESNMYLKKPYNRKQPFKKEQKKEINPLEIMMNQARRNNKSNKPRNIIKRKDIDFL